MAVGGEDNVVGSAKEQGKSGDLLGVRQRDAERDEARREFEFDRVVSCGQRWRTKLDFRSREHFDDRHWGATLRTAPSVAELDGGSISPKLLFWRCPQCLEAEGQGGGTLAVGQKTEVADAHETFGEQMQQETAQEVIERYGHQLLFVVMRGITPAERDVPFGKRDQTMVRDGYAMGVAA